MTDEIEKRKNWSRKFISIFVGLIATTIIIVTLPKLSQKRKIKETIKEIKSIKKPIVESIKEDMTKDVAQITSGNFKKYKITFEVEFKDNTEVKKALIDLKKACFIIKSSPTIKKLTPIMAKGIKKKDGFNMEYNIKLDCE